MVSSGIVANTDYVKANADLVKRFMAATTKAVEAAEKDPKSAAQSILDANPARGVQIVGTTMLTAAANAAASGRGRASLTPEQQALLDRGGQIYNEV